ncbi:MAG: hypothetical protein U0Q18_17880 [Bryobacteraceae bacterium]
MKCVIAILFLAANTFAASIGFSTGQAARLVIGQPRFDSESATATQTIVGAVSGVAYANNTLFIADSNLIGALPVNNRVLVYRYLLNNQLPPLDAELVYNKVCPACVGVADVVLGQPDYLTTTPIPCIQPTSSGTTVPPGTLVCPTNAPTVPQATGMRTPTAVASDGTHLVVADTQNNRVLIWNTIPTTNNQPPDVVVGQTDFTHATIPPNSTPTASSLRAPQGVWIQNGKLYIADTQNNRVLIYNSIPTSNGASADVVLGQPNFTTFVQVDIAQQKTDATAKNMLSPVSVTSDGQHLFVTDLGYNRVLIWNSLPTSNEAPADLVVGQQNLTTSIANNAYTVDSNGVQTPVMCTVSNGTDSNSNKTYPNLCKYTLSFPRFALSDGIRLFIADGGNDRVLVYNTVPTSSGAGADVVLGQANDIVDQPTNASDSLNGPLSLAYDGTNLYVADSYNQRVVVYTPAELDLTLTSVRNAASQAVYAVGTVIFGGTIKSGDKVTVTIQSKAYSYTIQSSDTYASIVEAFVALINASSGDPNVIATPDPLANELLLTARAEGIAGNSVTLAAAVSTGAQITATASGTVLSGGGNAAAVAPGTLVSILGSNLSDNIAAAPYDRPLPTKLGGVRVYFNGVAAPLLYVSRNQINSQIPFSFTDTGSINAWVRIERNDGTVSVTNPEGARVVTANPGIFTRGDSTANPRPALALHSSAFGNGVISVDGVVHAGDVGTICIGSTVSGCTGGRTYNYTVQASDTLATVVSAFVALLSSDPQVQGLKAAAFTRLVIQARTPGTAGNGIPFQASVSSGAKLLLTVIGPAPPSPGIGALTCCASNGGEITVNNPAVPGETIVVYATGLGLPVLTDSPPVKKYVITGQPYEGSADNTPQQFVSSLTNNKTANVIGAGLAPGMIGVYQVNLQLNTSLTTDPATQLTIAQNSYVSNIVTFPLLATPTVASVSCGNTTLNSKGTTTCTVTMTVAVPSTATTVALASNNAAISVPSSVSVAAGATAAAFTATASTVTTAQTATITATLNSSTATTTITVNP